MLFQCTSSGATMGIDSGFGSADMDCESRHISPKKNYHWTAPIIQVKKST